jgi:hypothetical protein
MVTAPVRACIFAFLWWRGGSVALVHVEGVKRCAELSLQFLHPLFLPFCILFLPPRPVHQRDQLVHNSIELLFTSGGTDLLLPRLFSLPLLVRQREFQTYGAEGLAAIVC